jgi:hypothetical protein
MLPVRPQGTIQLVGIGPGQRGQGRTPKAEDRSKPELRSPDTEARGVSHPLVVTHRR